MFCLNAISSTPASQTIAHSSQNVHPFVPNTMYGEPSLEILIISSSQTVSHLFSQVEHSLRKRAASLKYGGLKNDILLFWASPLSEAPKEEKSSLLFNTEP